MQTFNSLPETVRQPLQKVSDRDLSGAQAVYDGIYKGLVDAEFRVTPSSQAITLQLDWDPVPDVYKLIFKNISAVSMRKIEDVLHFNNVHDITVQTYQVMHEGAVKTGNLDITVSIFKHKTIQRLKKGINPIPQAEQAILMQNIDGLSLPRANFERAKVVIQTMINMDVFMIEPAWKFVSTDASNYSLTATPFTEMSAAFYNYLSYQAKGAVKNCVITPASVVVHCNIISEDQVDVEPVSKREDRLRGVGNAIKKAEPKPKASRWWSSLF